MTPASRAAAIELVAVSKRYERSGRARRRPTNSAPPSAVVDLDLRIEHGELVCMVGPSGCGKTTTLRLINGLEQPTSGQVLVDGRDISQVAPHELRRGIGYVIQQVGLFPHRKVLDNIATVPRLLGWPAERIRERVEELCDLVRLDRTVLTRYPAELSGGQQQRVGVARALAADPPILLMDEPYSAVDPVVRGQLQSELRQIHRRLGTTIVFVTHDIDEALVLADRVAVFAPEGRLAQLATPTELLGAPADEYVEEFCGKRRHLRLLGLRPIKDLLDGSDAMIASTSDRCVTVHVDETGLDALDAALAGGADTVVVVDGDTTVGVVSVRQLIEGRAD